MATLGFSGGRRPLYPARDRGSRSQGRRSSRIEGPARAAEGCTTAPLRIRRPAPGAGAWPGPSDLGRIFGVVQGDRLPTHQLGDVVQGRGGAAAPGRGTTGAHPPDRSRPPGVDRRSVGPPTACQIDCPRSTLSSCWTVSGRVSADQPPASHPPIPRAGVAAPSTGQHGSRGRGPPTITRTALGPHTPRSAEGRQEGPRNTRGAHRGRPPARSGTRWAPPIANPAGPPPEPPSAHQASAGSPDRVLQGPDRRSPTRSAWRASPRSTPQTARTTCFGGSPRVFVEDELHPSARSPWSPWRGAPRCRSP